MSLTYNLAHRWGAPVLLLAGLIACAARPSVRAQPPGESCGDERMSCQTLVDRFLYNRARALAVTEGLQSACKRGDTEACWAVGWFLADGAGVPTHPTRARELFTRQCTAGHAPSCRGLGWMMLDGLGGPSDLQAAQGHFRSACDAGDHRACFEYGRSFERLGRTLLPEDAVSRLETACRAKEPQSCTRLTAALFFERGGHENETRALKLAKSGCDTGSVASCSVLGVLRIIGIGGGRDILYGHRLIADACKKGDADACVLTASTQEHATLAKAKLLDLCNGGDVRACDGVGMFLVDEKDPAVLPIVRLACDRNYATGCYNLAVAYFHGVGVAASPFGALPFLRRACDLGKPEGCYWLSNAYYSGEHVPRDDRAGDQVLAEACSRGVAEACFDLAGVREQDGDPRAQAAYETACTAGWAEACTKAGAMHRKAKDVAGARPFYRRGCELRDGESCFRVSEAALADNSAASEVDGSMAAARACYLGRSIDGCFMWAYYLFEGRGGVPQDRKGGLVLAEQSCTSRSALGCTWVGMFYFGVREAALALDRFTRGCEYGNAYSCTLLGWMHVLGDGTDQDEPAARRLFKHACSAGDPDGCLVAYQMLSGGLGGSADQKQAMEMFHRYCDLRGCVQLAPDGPPPPLGPPGPSGSKTRGPFAKQTGSCDAAAWADIPAGSATMRWSLGTYQDASAVRLSPFRIRTTEVTQCQYLACVKAKRCTSPDAANLLRSDAAMLPVTGVTHAQAETYCAWEGGRLPSEAEWVYAAQGSGQPKYPWGDDEPACVVEKKKCASDLALAGATTFDISPFGVRDMAGTVAEWTGDWFGRWLLEPGVDPMGPATGVAKVVRGGEPKRPVYSLLMRGRQPPDRSLGHVGFRCVRQGAR